MDINRMTTFKDTIDHVNKLAADVDSTFALEPGRRSRQRELLQQEFIKLKAMMSAYISQFLCEEANTECLEGIRCPHCKSLEPFDISCKGWMIVFDDPEQGDHRPRDPEWDEDSRCLCLECHHLGKVKDFKQ